MNGNRAPLHFRNISMHHSYKKLKCLGGGKVEWPFSVIACNTPSPGLNSVSGGGGVCEVKWLMYILTSEEVLHSPFAG